MKRLCCLVMIGLFFITNIFGCSARRIDENEKIIRVGFWGTPEEVEIINNIISKWNEKNQGVKVRLDHTNYSGYSSKILTQMAGGAAPDVICVEVDMFVNFVKKGVLAPLNEFVAADPNFKINEFFPEVLNRFTVDNKLFCVPRDTAPFACVYYNKKIFDDAGISYPTDDWTWTDLLEISKKLTIKGDDGLVKQYGFYAWAWQNFVYGNGGKIVDNVQNPTKCLLDEDAAINGLQFFSDLINVHQVMPAPTAITNIGMGIQSMFVTGKLAMFCSGIWETPILRNKTKIMAEKGEKFDWDVVMFPKNSEGKRGFGTGGSGYAITESCKNKKEAWDVIKSLVGEDGQVMLAKTGLAQPANQRIAEGESWALSNEMPLNKKMLNQAVKYVTYNPFHERWAEIQQQYIVPKLELVFNGKLTVKEAVAKFIEDVNKMLKEDREK